VDSDNLDDNNAKIILQWSLEQCLDMQLGLFSRSAPTHQYKENDQYHH